VTDIFPCPDGHAQERSLFNEVLERVQPLEVWCINTASFYLRLQPKKSLLCNSSTWSFWLETSEELKLLGKTETGTLLSSSEKSLEGNQVRRVYSS